MRVDNQLLVTKTNPRTTSSSVSTSVETQQQRSMSRSSSSSSSSSSGSDVTPTRLFSTVDNSLAQPLDDQNDNNIGDKAGMISSSSTTGPSSIIFAKHPDEPNLYQIPSGLYPVYQPLPILLRVGVWLLAALTSAGLTWTRTLSPLVDLAKNQVSTNILKVVSFLIKAVIFATLSNAVLQDILVPPTRISIGDLMERYVLPSTFSRYETVPLQLPSSSSSSSDLGETTELGVHYLQYKQSNSNNRQSPSTPPRFQALYVNHGFGASSLSWLPALPKMVDRFHAKVGLGHDAAGFGFTDRPSNKNEVFSITGSAAIGTALLKQQLETQAKDGQEQKEDSDQQQQQQNEEKQVVLLMGHSMGSLATLQMALSLPTTMKKQIILVAPALGMRPANNRKRQVVGSENNQQQQSRGTSSRGISYFQRAAGLVGSGANAVGRYGLRRLVGGKNFWRKGLELAWGDRKRLLDGDVLRFQWPSIGKGWEDGLLKYTRAMAQTTSFTDRELVERVLESNATITVIVGGKDPVVPSKTVQTFFQPYVDRIRIVEMEGLGHDPFEEDVDGFVDVVERLLEEDSD